MRIPVCALAVVCLAAGVATGPARAADTLTVTVTPDIISINAYGSQVTVHTSIRFADVDHNALSLSGLAPDSVRPDTWGRLEARFDMDGVKAVVSPPRTILVLRGQRLDGSLFSGADTIRVRN